MRAGVGTGRRILLIAFALGLIVRVAALPLRGTEDVRVFKVWTASALSTGVFAVYRQPVHPVPVYEMPDYPPLSVLLLTAAAAALRATWGDVPVESRVLTVVIKALPLVAALAVFAFVRALVRQRTRDPAGATVAALLFWLNPAFVLNSSVLGYLDVLCWAPGLAAVTLASSRRFGMAAMLAAIAMLIKPQGVFFAVPVIAAALGDRRHLAQAATVATATLAGVVAPFVWMSGMPALTDAMRVNAFDDVLSGNALNVWWLVTLGVRAVEHGWAVLGVPIDALSESSLARSIGFTPRLWMAAVVATAAAAVMRQLQQTPAPPEAAGRRLALLGAGTALIIHVYCVLAISVHENHLIYAVAMLGLAALCDARYLPLFLAVSLFSAINMGLFYGIGRDGPVPSRTGWFVPVTALLSLVNVALLMAHARLFDRVRLVAGAPPRLAHAGG